MPIRADILSQLAGVLAELYYDLGNIRAMTIMAGLKLQQIPMYPRASDTWVFVLEEAEVQGCTQVILDRARSEKPAYEPLRQACQAYAEWIAADRPTTSPLDVQARSMHSPSPDADSLLFHRAGTMDYALGFAKLRTCLEGHDHSLLTTLATLEDRFRRNQEREKAFGVTPETKSDHSEVIHALNDLALGNCRSSFNDLCYEVSKSTSMPGFPPASGTFAAEQANYLRSLIRQCQLHLKALKKQQEAFGIHTPHNIVVEIDNTQSEMTKWAEELARLELSHEADTQYDVAILCYQDDHHLAEIIAIQLQNRNFNVWFEPWGRIPGSRIEDRLEHQISLAPVCAIVVGPATPETWLANAIELALDHQAVFEKYRILPVLLPQCTDSVIARYPSIRECSDFRSDIRDDWAFHVLIQSIKGLPLGPRSGKPLSTTGNLSLYRQQLKTISVLADEGLIEPEVKDAAQREVVNQILLGWA